MVMGVHCSARCMYILDAVFAVADGWRVEVDCSAAGQVLAVCPDGMDGWLDGWMDWMGFEGLGCREM